MAETDYFLAIKKGIGRGIIRVAARHNLREWGGTASVVVSRSHLNVVMAGSDNSQDVALAAATLLKQAGVEHKRKDAVRMIELVFSVPLDSAIVADDYFRDCLEWTRRQFVADNLLSFVAHHDEGAPHAHALIMPLRDGKLCGSDIVGGRGVMEARNVSFFAEVAKKHGLSRPVKLSLADRAALSGRVIEALHAVNDPMLSSPHWRAIRNAIEAHPAGFGHSLQLASVSRSSQKSFAQIMTGKGRATTEDKAFKGSNNFRARASRPAPVAKCIEPHEPVKGSVLNKPFKASNGNLPVRGMPHSEPYLVKGFALEITRLTTATPSSETEIRYVRDDDQRGQWDERTGEFVQSASASCAAVSLLHDSIRAQEWEQNESDSDERQFEHQPEFGPH